MRRRALLIGGVAAGTALALHADEALWALLRAGGQVVLIRHALTTPGVGDPQGMRIDDCGTQRNLNDEGRAEARRLGEAWRARGIVPGALLSSPWCRCLETARIAFGREARVEPALGNIFGAPEREAPQMRRLRPLVGAKPEQGNTVMLSHGSTILALTGVSPATAEMVIVTPQAGGGIKVAGRLRVA